MTTAAATPTAVPGHHLSLADRRAISDAVRSGRVFNALTLSKVFGIDIERADELFEKYSGRPSSSASMHGRTRH